MGHIRSDFPKLAKRVVDDLVLSKEWRAAVMVDSSPLIVALVDAAAARAIWESPSSPTLGWSDAEEFIGLVRREGLSRRGIK